MRIPFILVIVTILSSCCEKCPEKSEKKPKHTNTILKVDLPDDPKTRMEAADPLTIIVTEEDQYVINGKEYEFDSIELYIEDVRQTDPNFNNIIKIKGDRDASYHAVFKLITLADQLHVKPSLAYRK